MSLISFMLFQSLRLFADRFELIRSWVHKLAANVRFPSNIYRSFVLNFMKAKSHFSVYQQKIKKIMLFLEPISFI